MPGAHDAGDSAHAPALDSRGALSTSTGASCGRCHRAPAPPERGGHPGAGLSIRAAGLTDSTGPAELASGSHGPQGSPGVGARPSRPPGPAPPHSSPRHRRRGSVDEDHRRPLEPGVSLRTSPAHGVTPTRHTRTRKVGRQAATCSVTPPQVATPPPRIDKTGPQAHHFRAVERPEPRRIVTRCSGAPDGAILGSERLARTRVARHHDADQRISCRSPTR